MQFGVHYRAGRTGFRRLALGLAVTTALVPAALAQAEGELVDLGWISGEVRSSEAYGVNGAGTVVVGTSVDAAAHAVAVRWDAEGDLMALGTLGGRTSYATGVSLDGRRVVGTSTDQNDDYRAFLWTEGGGMRAIGTLGGSYSYATDISADGLRVVGTAEDGQGKDMPFLFIDGATTGIAGNPELFKLDLLAGGDSGRAEAISRNGSFATGYVWYDQDGEGAIWSLDGVAGGSSPVRGIGSLGGIHTAGTGISNDGRVVVGHSVNADNDKHAFRWVDGQGMADLGTLGGSESAAYALSADGAVAVGVAKDAGEMDVAFRWTEAGDMQSVGDWLAAAGVDMDGMLLTSASGVSDDGQVVVGTRRSIEGDDLAYLARVTPDKAGVIDIAAYTATLYQAGQLAYAGQHLSWLPLTGAHHRSLMDYPTASRDTGAFCGWATGDFARYGSGGRDAAIGLAEAGLCGDFADGQVRAGIGLGTSHARQALPLGGSAVLDGRYGVGEIDFRPADTAMIFSLTGVYGVWSADLRRAYGNGAGVDFSTGATRVQTALLRAKLEWRDALTLGTTGFSPWGAVTVGTTHVDGFAETGGGFPARFDAQDHVSVETRLGVTATTALGGSTVLKTGLEAVHRFDGQGGGVSGSVPGAFAFTLPAAGHGQTWLRAGVDLDQKLGGNAVLTVSLHGATSGQDGDVSGALGLHAGF